MEGERAHVKLPSKTGNRSSAATATMTNDAEKTGPWSARDEELILEYAETGSRLAFEELVRRFEREIYSYLRHHLGDAHLAEDAFQATFLRLHLKCHQFRADRRLRPWLYTIASNQATDLLRRNRRHKAVSLSAAAGCVDPSGERRSLGDLLEAADASPSQRLESAEDYQKTRSAIENISAKRRLVLDLVAYQGLKYREAADVLGIPEGTVKSRMNKTLQSLRKSLSSPDMPCFQRDFKPADAPHGAAGVLTSVPDCSRAAVDGLVEVFREPLATSGIRNDVRARLFRSRPVPKKGLGGWDAAVSFQDPSSLSFDGNFFRNASRYKPISSTGIGRQPADLRRTAASPSTENRPAQITEAVVRRHPVIEQFEMAAVAPQKAPALDHQASAIVFRFTCWASSASSGILPHTGPSISGDSSDLLVNRIHRTLSQGER